MIVEAVPVTLPTIPAVTVKPLKVPTEVMFGCAAVVIVEAVPVTEPTIGFVTVKSASVHTEVRDEPITVALSDVPVRSVASAVIATLAPAVSCPL